MKFQMKNQVKGQIEEEIKIVKHSNDLNGVLTTLETADSIDKQTDESILLPENITPKKCLKNRDISNYISNDNAGINQNNDALNLFESHSSSLNNSFERTTAPSSKISSFSRQDISHSSILSPNISYQTPCNRLNKKRNLSNSSLDVGVNFNRVDLNMNQKKNEILNSGISNMKNNNQQLSAPVLLSAVLQVIASIQKLKNNSIFKKENDQGKCEMINGESYKNNNTTAQILGSKLPGVHPATAALALAYSLSVAASTSMQQKDINSFNARNNIISEEILQNINQLISERINNINNTSLNNGENIEHIKLNNEILQNITTSLNSAISQSNESNIQKEFETKTPKFFNKTGSSAYNLKLPPMDFINSEKMNNIGNHSIKNLTSELQETTFNNNTFCEDNLDHFEYISDNSQNIQNNTSKFNDNRSSCLNIQYDNDNILNSHLISLESSNNCIWNDISYNQALQNNSFEIPYSRKHAYLRNEILFYNKPKLEVERNVFENNTAGINSNYFNYNEFHVNQKHNTRIQSLCDELLVNNSNNKKNNIINSVNSLMQIVGNSHIQ